MGITGVPLTHLFDTYYEDERTKLWCYLYHTTYAGPITIQEEEVDSVYLKTGPEILQEMEHGAPYNPDSVLLFRKFWESRA
jgi:hypothetical protein